MPRITMNEARPPNHSTTAASSGTAVGPNMPPDVSACTGSATIDASDDACASVRFGSAAAAWCRPDGEAARAGREGSDPGAEVGRAVRELRGSGLQPGRTGREVRAPGRALRRAGGELAEAGGELLDAVGGGAELASDRSMWPAC